MIAVADVFWGLPNISFAYTHILLHDRTLLCQEYDWDPFISYKSDHSLPQPGDE